MTIRLHMTDPSKETPEVRVWLDAVADRLMREPSVVRLLQTPPPLFTIKDDDA